MYFIVIRSIQLHKCSNIHLFLIHATYFSRQFRTSSGDITIYESQNW